jgi:hypothetical protein
MSNAIDRFLAKVQKTDGCWHWTGCVLKGGYGQFSYEGKHIYAHRFSYEHHTGERIPTKRFIDHLCRNRACVNPKHLEVVTNAENVQRGIPYRPPRDTTKCKHGHCLTEANTYQLNSYRSCRMCSRIAQAKLRRKRRLITKHTTI